MVNSPLIGPYFLGGVGGGIGGVPLDSYDFAHSGYFTSKIHRERFNYNWLLQDLILTFPKNPGMS